MDLQQKPPQKMAKNEVREDVFKMAEIVSNIYFIIMSQKGYFNQFR